MSSPVPQQPVVLIMGPTASGKTALSLALTEHFDCEIVSVDSAQVYRGLDIGSAKPDAAAQGRVRHHLIDILDPAEAYSAARFAADALRLVAEIRERGRVPLLVGGTMLYFRALTRGLSELPSADAELRRRLEAQAARDGWPALHARLAGLDPQTAARLHPNDQQRIQRALELVELTGQPLQQLRQARSPVLAPPYLKLVLALPERADLHARIALRFRQMMDQGFLEEVSRLRARGDLHLELPALRAVGYRQLWRHLDGAYGYHEAVERGIVATRQFAKRQLTWLRSETSTEPGALQLDPLAADFVDKALHAVRCFPSENAC